MSTADLSRPIAESFAFRPGQRTSRARPQLRSDTTPLAGWITLIASCVALITSTYLAWSSLTSLSVAVAEALSTAGMCCTVDGPQF